MGSEQSTQKNEKSKIRSLHLNENVKKGQQVLKSSTESTDYCQNRSSSPGLSVCSDSDLPYISYTVNRPIGVDSPKISSKPSSFHREKSFGSVNYSSSKRKFENSRKVTESLSKSGNIIVVKAPKEPECKEKDLFLLKLQSIPMFLPIMRGTLNLPGKYKNFIQVICCIHCQKVIFFKRMRDPEILERLDPQDLLGLCKKLQNYMSLCVNCATKNQNQIINRIREVDFELCHLVVSLGERQKKLVKETEKISKIKEISVMLNKCHSQLNHSLELIEILNNALPSKYRLEPFVWTTG
ncbi:hypothetical protein Phum_PHUM544550 [Pediculus humanus corporis]|uniref:BLOC-1-related complex subunit 5 n=1 Tax=Pediculus humanus subsp. corporis TaxID=121224 RepID=E0W036_PEDHC|nr:uncharacterized protein Phum_PHUM544550 [Pediculus humanus corporis]EEB18992.1 hypothetical protein Phum_PHUM544550 [Pediculus humanus corporis]